MNRNTRDYLMSFYEVSSEARKTGVWWAWELSEMAGEGRYLLSPEEGVYKYSTREAACLMAEGWIQRNLPRLAQAAEAEAQEAAKYQAAQRLNTKD